MLAWRDVLHEGPVPAGLSPMALREIRARYIAAMGWGQYRQVLAQFEERDGILEAAGQRGEILLWFESDLYDQLQFLQVLDLLSRSTGARRPSLLCRPAALATLRRGEIRALMEARVPLTDAQVASAAAAWEAFRSPDPSRLDNLVKTGSPGHPYLGAALFRLLQQFPSTHNGLSRSEQNALEVIASGRSRLGEAFVASHHEREEKIFLGERVFASYLEGLSLAERPLLLQEDGTPLQFPADGSPSFWDSKAVLTRDGEDVLKGKQDNVRINGIRRWIGGVYLTGNGGVWRWDADSQSLLYR